MTLKGFQFCDQMSFNVIIYFFCKLLEMIHVLGHPV